MRTDDFNPARLDLDQNDIYYKKLDWLEKYGYTTIDVFEDELGREYVYDIEEDGRKSKVFLLDVIYD